VTTPSDTPRSNEADSRWETSDSAVDAFNEAIDLCRQLERELAAANENIQRLINAGDAMATRCSLWTVSSGDFLVEEDRLAVSEWTKAKEGAK